MDHYKDRLAAALDWAAHGVPVLPVRVAGKAPLTRHGLRDATTDPGVVHEWWRRWPAANLAMATGYPGVDVLDVDVRGDASGWAALRRLLDVGLVPRGTPVVRTPSVINGRFCPLFVVCGEPCQGERSSSIQCYQPVFIDVMKRHRLPRHVGGIGGAGSRRETAPASPAREG